LGCLLCGLSILLENKSRRMELALYCAPRAIYSLYQKAAKHKLLPIVPGFSNLLFVLSATVVLFAHKYEPSAIRGSINRGLQWFMGV